MVVIKEIQKEEEAESSRTDFDHEYDVFLSFRGEDTRFGFTDHLHKALLEADINTFLDDDCIQTGEDLKPELEIAIKQSRASVIVLSKNYANSTWCLNELVLILQQRRKFGMIVFPIFYHVDPSHVRKQEDSFADALKKHEKSIEEETDPEKKQERIHKLKLWRNALKEVADLKGKDIKGWHETRFIEQIVTEIDHRLGRNISHTFQDFIGMVSQVRSIESWLQDGSILDVDFTTICGMGGIGKTTLARYIYETNVGLFESSCFLGNIRNISASVIPDGKLSLQKQLLKDIKGKQDISRVDEGTSMIEKVLKRKRVLLVLDDVNNVDQLDVLLGTKGFHPGSKIIITTKDRLLPKKCEVWNTKFSSKKYTEHLLEGLDIDGSLELLSLHAFRCDSPKVGFEEPTRKVVKYCGGHPLALKVLGSSLFQRDVAAWEDTLELLRKETDSKIHNALKISFDSLSSENDKKLFKYIACFFVGKDTDYIGKVLKECDIYTSSGIPNLIDKCLLTVNTVNCVEMHQLLQDLGRHIVHHESWTKPWKRSILCCHKEAFNVLKDDMGTEITQGLLLDKKIPDKKLCVVTNGKETYYEDDQHLKNSRTLALLGWFHKFIYRFWWLFGWLLVLLCSKFHREEDEEEGNLKTESFTKMKNLELLQLNFIQLTGSYEKFPKRLKWLCWHGFPSHYIPPDLPITKLVVLDMSHSNLKGLWTMPKSNSLKILNLSNSLKLIGTGDFAGVPNLERLILAGCGNLVEISESIGELRQLALLDLSFCASLRNLPRNMRKLSKTKTLRLNGCCNLFKTVVPQSTQSSWLLLPQFIKELNLSGNDLHNESFPVDFSSLSSLTKLNLSNNPIDSLPDCVRSLKRIFRLIISDCDNLKTAIDLPSSIIPLEVAGCGSLERITFHLSSYIWLDIYPLGCHKLREGKFFFELEKVGKPITNRLGWASLGYLEQQEVMMYKGKIFSTSFFDDKVPHWFTYKTKCSSISFTVPPSPNKKRIRGLKLCLLMTIPFDELSALTTVIVNMTNNLRWVFTNGREHYLGFKTEVCKVVMIDWIIENNNELSVGDQVYIHHYIHRDECWNDNGNGCCNPLRWIFENKEFDISDVEEHCKNIKECGVDIVNDEHNIELRDTGTRTTGTRTLDFYNLWEDNNRYILDSVRVELCDLLQISIHGN